MAFSPPGSLGQSRNVLMLGQGCFPKGLHVSIHQPRWLVGSCFPHPLASPPHSPGCSCAGGCGMAFVFFSYRFYLFFMLSSPEDVSYGFYF